MEAQKLSDLIDESNGKKTIWQQFAEVRASIRNMHISIQSLFVRMTVAEATDIDHDQRISKLEKEMNNAS
jgi:hypothetical protein